MEAEGSAYTGLSCAKQEAWDRSDYSDYSNNKIKVTKYLLRFSLILKCCMEIFGFKEIEAVFQFYCFAFRILSVLQVILNLMKQTF